MLGERIGPYVVESELGRGGMGEVFQARDERLQREVALKFLPREFAEDDERLARFEREARMLAVLQHQNIAAIYGLEQHDGRPVLVMELAEGQDLAARLEQGPLAADEAERLARQLAAGLEHAHEQNVVHRDLKPSNLKVATDGRLKILDFGLARAFEGAPPGSQAALASGDTITMAQGPTGVGTVVGTAAYMSPEQARGYEVDRRADIWAFGVIIYEMLAGQRLFTGETATDTLAAVLRKDPEWDALPADAPAVLVQLCRRCLERDPQLRLRDIGEARIALEGSSSTMIGLPTEVLATLPGPRERRRSSRVPWLAAAGALAVAVLAVLAGVTGRLGPQPEPPRLVRSSVILPEGLGVFVNPNSPGAPVISPDGTKLAFVGQDTTGAVHLCLRSLDSDEVTVVPDTRGASYPFWSPDSRSVAYIAQNGLHRVDTGGGPVQLVCHTENAKWGSWNDADRILYSPSHSASIHVVPAGGGDPVPVTDIEAEGNSRSHRFPRWLPDGEHFLYLVWFSGSTAGTASGSVLRVASVDGEMNRDLMLCQSSAVYFEGHILYVHDNNLMARPFSLDSLDFTGPPRAVLGDVLLLGGAQFGAFTVSETGILAFMAAGGSFGEVRLEWTEGEEREVLIDRARSIFGFDISPDGKRIAIALVDDQLGSYDIWIHEIERSLATRFTFAPESEYGPRWSADGKWIAYTGEHEGQSAVFRKPVTGGGRPELVVDSDVDAVMGSWSPDGRTIAFTNTATDGSSIGLIEVEGDGEARKYRDVPYEVSQPDFSPDGRWLTYVTDETGQPEIFVEAVAANGGRWRISSDNGFSPRWSADGRRVYYLGANGDLLATEVEAAAAGLVIGRTSRIATGVVTSIQYTYSEDRAGKRLLVQVPAQADMNRRIELVTNWQSLLREGDD